MTPDPNQSLEGPSEADRLEGLDDASREAVELERQRALADQDAVDASLRGLEQRGRARLTPPPMPATDKAIAYLDATREAIAYLDGALSRSRLPVAVLDRLTREQRDELNLERVNELEQAIRAALEALR